MPKVRDSQREDFGHDLTQEGRDQIVSAILGRPVSGVENPLTPVAKKAGALLGSAIASTLGLPADLFLLMGRALAPDLRPANPFAEFAKDNPSMFTRAATEREEEPVPGTSEAIARAMGIDTNSLTFLLGSMIGPGPGGKGRGGGKVASLAIQKAKNQLRRMKFTDDEIRAFSEHSGLSLDEVVRKIQNGGGVGTSGTPTMNRRLLLSRGAKEADLSPPFKPGDAVIVHGRGIPDDVFNSMTGAELDRWNRLNKAGAEDKIDELFEQVRKRADDNVLDEEELAQRAADKADLAEQLEDMRKRAEPLTPAEQKEAEELTERLSNLTKKLAEKTSSNLEDLRPGVTVNIRPRNPEQALNAIRKTAEHIEEFKRSGDTKSLRRFEEELDKLSQKHPKEWKQFLKENSNKLDTTLDFRRQAQGAAKRNAERARTAARDARVSQFEREISDPNSPTSRFLNEVDTKARKRLMKLGATPKEVTAAFRGLEPVLKKAVRKDATRKFKTMHPTEEQLNLTAFQKFPSSMFKTLVDSKRAQSKALAKKLGDAVDAGDSKKAQKLLSDVKIPKESLNPINKFLGKKHSPSVDTKILDRELIEKMKTASLEELKILDPIYQMQKNSDYKQAKRIISQAPLSLRLSFMHRTDKTMQALVRRRAQLEFGDDFTEREMLKVFEDYDPMTLLVLVQGPKP